jgi:glycosyltransferase involved in cell wall biosynthesis
MRIGVVTTSYPRFAGDHAGSFVGAHVAALRALGHEVEVVCATERDTLFYRGGAPDMLERVGARALPAAASFTARLTARVVRRARAWDAIIAHWLVPSAIAALPTRLPMLAIAHGGDVHTLRRMHLLEPVIRALRLRGAKLAFVSDELRAMAKAPDAIVQPMGIDVAHFAALGRAATDPPTIAFIGRLVPVKGHDVALRAIDHVRAPARLVIAGDAPLDGARMRTRDERPVRRASHRVQYLGAVDGARRDQLLREASVVVIPSRVLPNGRSEGVPLVALEALAAGVPVVASAVGGLRELPRIAGGGIDLVPPEDPCALADAIDRVLAKPPPRADLSQLDWNRVALRLLP